MTRDQEEILEAMVAIVQRIKKACDASWSAESIAVFVDSLVRLHSRYLLQEKP